MSQIPKEFENVFIDLEMQAGTLLRKGYYDLSESLYNVLLDKIYIIQNQYNIRIHKGSHYYNIGLATILQNKLLESLKNMVLAYIEDTFNFTNEADSYPAAKVLTRGFFFISSNFNVIKKISKENITNLHYIKDPRNLFKDFLKFVDVNENKLLSLCDPQPTIDSIKISLFTHLTKEASSALNKIIEKSSKEILDIATRRAREKGHPDTINEEDIIEAIKIYEVQKA